MPAFSSPPPEKTDAALSPAERNSLTNPPICPKCGARMRLARIEPQLPPAHGTGQITFDCACGYLHVDPGDQPKLN
jgi:hypothetical protein